MRYRENEAAPSTESLFNSEMMAGTALYTLLLGLAFIVFGLRGGQRWLAFWGGTMVLTESEAGSDVGALTTAAGQLPDGTYAVTGNKIFITGCEHDMTENIIHPVLARIEGASAGTLGISLFIVPKIWVNEDGTLGETNDVVCSGIEEKMGIHASSTCSMALGGKGTCRGLLLGDERHRE